MKRMTFLGIVFSVIVLAGVSYANGFPGFVVDVDIKPQSCPNAFNLESKGVLTVAILGTEDFDVTQIDPATILLEGVSPLRWSLEDVAPPPINGFESQCDCTSERPDGFTDLVLKFKSQEVNAALVSPEIGDVITLPLTGNLFEEFGGIPIGGGDCVLIQGPHNLNP